jgi:hypothetical protein
MGSSTGKNTREYLDVYDLLTNYGEDDYQSVYNDTTVNVFPQENINIPLADEISGLRDYFCGFINLENDMAPLEPADIGISISKKSVLGSPYYEITWDKTSTDPGAVYTLVCYDMDGNIFSVVRTVNGGEEAIARVGNYAVLVGNQIRTVDYERDITETDRYFKIFVLLPDGRMQSSKLFYVDF